MSVPMAYKESETLELKRSTSELKEGVILSRATNCVTK